MPLVINAFGGGHTNTQTHMPMHKPRQFQETRHASAVGLKYIVESDNNINHTCNYLSLILSIVLI